MGKANQPLRNELKEKGIPYWQIAKHVGVNETTIVRWLRVPLIPEQAERIRVAIGEIIELREGGTGNAYSSYQSVQP